MKELVLFPLDQFLVQFTVLPCRKLSWHNPESHRGAGGSWYGKWGKKVCVLRYQYSLQEKRYVWGEHLNEWSVGIPPLP